MNKFMILRNNMEDCGSGNGLTFHRIEIKGLGNFIL